MHFLQVCFKSISKSLNDKSHVADENITNINAEYFLIQESGYLTCVLLFFIKTL